MGISTKTIIKGKDIIEYIPQRDPIIMVNEFGGIKDNVSFSGLTIDQNNIFCEDQCLNEFGLIEHIAQSAALRRGYISKSNGLDIPLGYMGSINKFRLYELPQIGSKLHTEITVLQEVMNISLISASVFIKEKLIAECQMKIFLKE